MLVYYRHDAKYFIKCYFNRVYFHYHLIISWLGGSRVFLISRPMEPIYYDFFLNGNLYVYNVNYIVPEINVCRLGL